MLFISKINENTGELILKVAKELAYTEGLGQISMRKVASNCDIGLGTIYNYYPTKTDIIFAVVEEFWSECFRNMRKVYNNELNFFEQLENVYFYILEYLKRFENNWLEDLTNLSSTNKQKGKQKEAQFIKKLINVFKELIENHIDEFNSSIFEKFTQEEISRFIIENFFIMLKRFEENYEFLDYTLKKILI